MKTYARQCVSYERYLVFDEPHLSQWDLQPGNLYLPVVTTQDGLWRYVIDDVLHVIGFDPHNGSPVFKFHGRKK